MHRLPTATFSVRQSLLEYILPWLYNMELVEPSASLLTAGLTNNTTDSLTVDSHGDQNDVVWPAGLLKGHGWGSPEATDMILNNLLYTTLTVGIARRGVQLHRTYRRSCLVCQSRKYLSKLSEVDVCLLGNSNRNPGFLI